MFILVIEMTVPTELRRKLCACVRVSAENWESE